VNPPIARAEVLVAQGRWDLAERELGQVLAEWPDSAYAHALLAACKRGRRDYPAAV
jgi:hypothetical protein